MDAEREAAEGGALARQRVLDGAQLVQLIHGGRRSAAHARASAWPIEGHGLKKCDQGHKAKWLARGKSAADSTKRSVCHLTMRRGRLTAVTDRCACSPFVSRLADHQ